MTSTYKDWHEKLPICITCIRNSIHNSTGATPFSIVYGMQNSLTCWSENPFLTKFNRNWIRRAYDQLTFIEEKRLTSLSHWKCYQKCIEWAYNRKVKRRNFIKDDLVLKKILPFKEDPFEKFKSNYKAPYLVTNVFPWGALCYLRWMEVLFLSPLLQTL